MTPLGRTSRKLLLAVHVLSASLWIGGVASLLVGALLHRHPATSDGLVVIRTTLQWVDRLVIVPACLVSLFTGLLFALGTPWGWFKHDWLTFKWAATVAMIVYGIVALGPWVDTCAELARGHGLGALADERYASLSLRVDASSVGQLALLVTMILLSSFKPSRLTGLGSPAKAPVDDG